MNQKLQTAPQAPQLTAWGTDLHTVLCEQCDWAYLVSPEHIPTHCPHCCHSGLTNIQEKVPDLPMIHPPELLIPFQLSSDKIAQVVEKFAKGIPFTPSDLTTSNLRKRLRALYLPMWLVDAEVQAIWKAETGFDYHVVSHQARFDENRGGWSDHEVKERRIRWEERAGKLTRSYQNISAPALEGQHALESKLGGYNLRAARPYQAEQLQNCMVRLPNRSPQDAWSDAKPAFQAAAAEECRQAAEAEHIRQFSWQPDYVTQNWTLLLMPVYSAYYLDDDRKPLPVLLNGQSGQISGERRASMKRAQRASLIILAVAIGIFVLGLALAAASLLFPPILIAGVIGMVIALLIAAAAVIPIMNVWWYNRNT